MMGDRASNYTRVTFRSGDDTAIADGGSITVFGIIATNEGDRTQTVILEEYNSNTEIARFKVPSNQTEKFEIKWLADKGLQVSLDPSTFYLSCTVFHSQKGA